jgi:polyhydroxyalkanoate synthesis regulator phasin
MDPKLEKAFRVSDGLASLAHKKITGMVRELEGEGVLTKEEGKKVMEGLGKVKKALYDNVSGELKKVLNKKKAAPKKSAKKRK